MEREASTMLSSTFLIISQIAEFLAAEQHGLKMGCKDADRVITGQDIRSDQAFSRPEAVRACVFVQKRIHDRESREKIMTPAAYSPGRT